MKNKFPEIIRTGNMAIDMISACMAHHKQHNKKVKFIYLSHKYWNSFIRFIGEKTPEAAEQINTAEAAEFKNVMIKKGSRLQIDPLYVELAESLN